MDKQKTILIGITGGIAAYKICELIRLFKKQNFNVKVVTTKNALNFVTELTLTTLSKNSVYVDNFDIKDYKPEHISLCNEADLMIIAPASANTISKISNGICDNLLTSIACAFNKKMLIAPAMNTNMWENKFIQENIEKLKKTGYTILEPEVGELACGTSGTGRLCKIEEIFNTAISFLDKKKILKNKKIVITAGGTIEKIDPVRYISNFSSGKMGVALADAANEFGANVTLISTFDAKKNYKNIVVQSAEEMKEAVEEEINDSDCVIMAAAVADYKIKNYKEQKIKKDKNNDNLILELVKNPDILKEICKKREKKSKTKIIGFCAESQNLIENAKNKITNKNCDYIIANDISRKDIGFSSNENEVYIINKNLETYHLNKDLKNNIARKILEYIFE